MQEDDIEQINLLVDLTTNKINQQLRANDKLSEGIYRILVNLDQVKDAVKKGEGYFFQNLSTHITSIENECKDLKKVSDDFKDMHYKLDNFFDSHSISLKNFEDFIDKFNSSITELNTNSKKATEILNELHEDKKNFVIWKGKVIFAIFIFGPLMNILIFLHQIKLINLSNILN